MSQQIGLRQSGDLRVHVEGAGCAGALCTPLTIPSDPFPFGDGWMTSNARDLCRIEVALGGLDAHDLVRRIAVRAGGSERMVNAWTVERVLEDMTDQWNSTACAGSL